MKWYYLHKKAEIDYIQKRKKKIKQWLLEFRSSLSCARCGEKHPAIIDFHHKKGKKENAISQMAADGLSINRIKAEIAKCEPLCANCHRKHHFRNNNL